MCDFQRFCGTFFAMCMLLASLAIGAHTYFAFETARLAPIVSFTFPGWAFILLLLSVGTLSNTKGRSIGGLKASAISSLCLVIVFGVFCVLGLQRLQSDGLKQDASTMYLDASQEQRDAWGSATDLYNKAWSNIERFLQLGVISIAAMV